MSTTSTTDTSFINSICNISLSPISLSPYASRPSYPEFYSSAFPVFSLHPSVSSPDLTRAIDQINQQACFELRFSDEELVEMGVAAALPLQWEMHDKEPVAAAKWHLEAFEKGGSSEDGDPRWYPLGFIGVDSVEWREERRGAVLVYFDVSGQRTKNEKVAVKAFRVDGERIGAAIISLRQGDDEIENVRRHSGLEG